MAEPIEFTIESLLQTLPAVTGAVEGRIYPLRARTDAYPHLVFRTSDLKPEGIDAKALKLDGLLHIEIRGIDWRITKRAAKPIRNALHGYVGERIRQCKLMVQSDAVDDLPTGVPLYSVILSYRIQVDDK